MYYLEYELETGLVVAIHRDEVTPQEGYGIAKTDSYQPGDEFEHSIYVLEVSEDGFLLTHSSIKNNPNAKRLLQENQELQSEVASLWYDAMIKESRIAEADREIADLWYEIMMGGV